MGRSESKAISKQSAANSSQDQANAQSSLTGTNKSLQDYKSNLDKFMSFGRSTYGQGGEFAKDQNAIANTTAAAGSNAIKGSMALNSMRTGENTASYAPALAESQRQAERDMTSQLANADSSRLDKLTAINQYGVQASALPAGVQAGLYGTSLGGSNAAEGTAASAAQASPGFWDVMGQDVAQGAGAALGAYAGCSCEGAVIQLPNGQVTRVESLKKGDYVGSMGAFRKPSQVIDDIVPIKQPCFEIVTVLGRRRRASASDALALMSGGYVCLKDSLGEAVRVDDGSDTVIAVTNIGEHTVYPLSLDGSHTYLADGFWILA